MGDRVITYYALKAFDHAVATGNLTEIRKLWPSIKLNLNVKPDYSRPVNQE